MHRAQERVELDRRFDGLGEFFDLGAEERLAGQKRLNASTAQALNEHLHRAVGPANVLHDLPDGADEVDVLGQRLVGLGLLLRCQHQLAAAAHRLFDRADRLGPADVERHHHAEGRRRCHEVAKAGERARQPYSSKFLLVAVR